MSYRKLLFHPITGQTIFKNFFKHPALKSSAIRSLSTSVTLKQDAIAQLENCNFFKQEHEELRKTVRKVIENDINPFVEEWEEKEAFPAHQVFKKMGDVGALGITRSPDYGGLGLDYTYTYAFLDELTNINCAGIPMGLSVQTDMATPSLASFGSDELKKQFLAPTIAGDYVCSVAVSESGGGSDVAALKTKAVRKGDDLIINGEKCWITNGCQADWVCLLANTSEGPIHKNKSLICVPMKLPGVHVARKIKKIGNHSSDTAQIFFEDVRVPAKYVIGEPGMGFIYQMMQFQYERMAASIMAVGGMQRAIKETIAYTKDRKAFGKPLISNQYIHYRIAELQTEVEALRSLVFRAVAEIEKGENVTLLATMAKLKAGRLSRELSDSLLQFWGGMGYTREAMIGRYFVDSRLMAIGGGADEVMLGILCKMLDIHSPSMFDQILKK